jgi:hypothetical protein
MTDSSNTDSSNTDSSNYFNILNKLSIGGFSGQNLSDLNAGQIYNKSVTLDTEIQNYKGNNPMSNILSIQDDMSGIMQTELNYLNGRQSLINQDIATGERLMQLNDSNRKRYYKYVVLVMIWVGTITLVLLLVYLKRIFTDLPFNLIFLLIITGALIWSILILYTIYTRDPTDFDKLYLTPPDFKATPVASATITDNTDSGYDSNGNCIGETCCRAGEVYRHDPVTGYGSCYILGTPNIPDSFTTMSGDNGTGARKISNMEMAGFQDKKEGFTSAVGNLLNTFPPNVGASIFPFYEYNYACEGDDYCVYRDYGK